jgi:ribosomal protein S18 acetylase RimI-like enzyme
LRQDTPGADGWRWEPQDFHEETFDFPSVYLVAQGYAGLCRVWLREPTPRLGFVGVRREDRRRGLARALLSAALGEVAGIGHARVTAEVDEENVASQGLFQSFGARRIGGFVELHRPSG